MTSSLMGRPFTIVRAGLMIKRNRYPFREAFYRGSIPFWPDCLFLVKEQLKAGMQCGGDLPWAWKRHIVVPISPICFIDQVSASSDNPRESLQESRRDKMHDDSDKNRVRSKWNIGTTVCNNAR